ncbi:MAG: hypothetical protein PF542_00320 [Nanoarchaeota archaeon]|jgi:hypothetical protein|nr:hypothetical protein [Nanoarchaeota archaeon]
MAICGFNEKMLEGLRNLFDGAIEHGIIDRAKKKGIYIEEQFQNEFQEISQWLFYCKNISDGPTQKIIEGIGLLIVGVFEKDLLKGASKYKENHITGTNLLRDLDDYFYGNLKGDKENMPQLFNWVNKNLKRYEK